MGAPPAPLRSRDRDAAQRISTIRNAGCKRRGNVAAAPAPRDGDDAKAPQRR